MRLILVILLTIFDSIPGVELVQDSAVAVLLDQAMHGERELVEIDGFRLSQTCSAIRILYAIRYL